MKIILVDAYNTLVTDNGLDTQMNKLLDIFSNKKIILTNADESKQKELGLINLPYPLFSLNFNPTKDNTQYYKLFLEKNNLQPDDVIYFEHNIDAVNSAKSVGINTYHYDHIKRDLESLKQFLNENL